MKTLEQIYCERQARIDAIRNGGKGSGNFGHSGRTGLVGGSGSGSGVESVVQTGTKRELFSLNGARDYGLGMTDIDGMKQFISTHHKIFPRSDTLDAVRIWESREGCQSIQQGIRENIKPDKLTRTLDKLTNENTLNGTVNLYRGMQMTQLELAQVAKSKTFKSKTFLAMSPNSVYTEELYASNLAWSAKDTSKTTATLIRLKASEGTKGYFTQSRWPSTDFMNNVGEFLPSRDNTYKVINVKQTTDLDGKYTGGIIDLETM